MPDRPPSPQQLIANEIAALYKTHYGRGPTTVSVHVVPGAVVCILEDVNSPTQASLLRYGAADVADATHQRLQIGMADEMRAIVERAVGRAVRTYVPGFNAEEGATTDTFLLATGPIRP